jgi:hypothetical protein
MDTYKHDYHVLPSVKGLRHRPSCRVSEFLLTPITTDEIFDLVGEACKIRQGESLKQTIRAILDLRGKRLSRTAMQILRDFAPLRTRINFVLLASLDAQNFVVWRHNVIVRMVAGQRSVEETMRLLRIAPAEVEYYAMDDPRWGVSGKYTF